MKRYILFILLAAVNIVTANICAQDLSNLTESARNSKLIEIARNVYKAPRLKNFYREFGTPTITKTKTVEIPTGDVNTNTKSIWYGSKAGQTYYIVYFQYDMRKELFEEGYAAKVYIWENTGSAFAIGLANRIILPVRNGLIPDHYNTPEPVVYYTLTYSKDVPDAAALPKTGKYGDVITINLTKVISVAYDGWTTEYGFNFEPDKDLVGGEIIHDYNTCESNTNSYKRDVRTVKIKVTGNMNVNVTKYVEEYEDMY